MSDTLDIFNKLLEYKDDPEELERQRKQIIDEFISSLPEDKQDRARQMQWRIDQERKHYKDPIAASNFMFGKMWNSFLELNNELQAAKNGNTTIPSEPTEIPNNVVAFEKR